MSWIVFPCRNCGEIQIARADQKTKQCSKCNARTSSEPGKDGSLKLPTRRTSLHVSTTVGEKEVETAEGTKRRGIKKDTSEMRVKVLGRFETSAEASDFARYVKLPPELRDPSKTELYQSSAWRKQHSVSEEKDEGL